RARSSARRGRSSAPPSLRDHPGVAADPASGRDFSAGDLQCPHAFAGEPRRLGAALSESHRADLRHHLQSRPSLVLVPAHAPRGGAGVQDLRVARRRPRTLDRPHGVPRPDRGIRCAAAREHRNSHARFFLRPCGRAPARCGRWSPRQFNTRPTERVVRRFVAVNTSRASMRRSFSMRDPDPAARRMWLTVGQFAATLAIVLLTKIVAAEAYYVPSGSMQPTLLIGDELAVTKFPYGYSRYSLPIAIGPALPERLLGRLPARGDVVVFRLPRDPSQTYVKRVVGLPGDRVQMRKGRLWING